MWRVTGGGQTLKLLPRLADFALPAWRTAEEIAHSDHQNLRDALGGVLPDSAILVAEVPPGGNRAGYVFATTKHDYFTHVAHAHVEVLAIEARRAAARSGACPHGRHRAMGEGSRLHVGDAQRVRGEHACACAVRPLGYEPETIHYRKAL